MVQATEASLHTQLGADSKQIPNVSFLVPTFKKIYLTHSFQNSKTDR